MGRGQRLTTAAGLAGTLRLCKLAHARSDGAARPRRLAGAVETRTRMRATREHCLIDAELDAYEGERRVFSCNWHSKIPRDLV